VLGYVCITYDLMLIFFVVCPLPSLLHNPHYFCYAVFYNARSHKKAAIALLQNY